MIKPLYQLVYTSISRDSLLQSELNRLVERCSASNREHGLTGLLLYDGQRFLQVVEGPKEAVLRRYERIKVDPRHHSVTELVERTVTKRHFREWDMGYRSAKKDELQKVLQGNTHQPAEILSLIKQLVIKETACEGDRHGAQPTILAVDDSSTNLKILKMILKKHYNVETALNGEDALAAASRLLPDLILLDVEMPGLNGYDVCARLQDNPLTNEIPVVFLSALGSTENKVTGLKMGACDYITKPFQREEILARVGSHIEMGRLQRDLRAHMKELESQNARLDRFARCLAHDLRSPITSVLGHASLLQVDSSVSAEARQSIEHIKDAGENLSEMVDSLLLMAIADHNEVEESVINPESLALSSRNELAELMADHSGQITIEDNLPPCLGHPPWLRRIFTNLFSNGIKYGGHPPHVILSSDTSNDGKVRYIISDNGRGLSEQQIGSLFSEFSRLEPDKAPGIGLGLILVKTLVQQMNGHVLVNSSPQNGTAFIIEMPAVRQETFQSGCAVA